jgi:hypothetical protein
MDSAREIAIPWLASRLGCTIAHAQALVRRGRIAGYKTPTGWVTTEEALETYLTAHSTDVRSTRGVFAQRIAPDSGID